MEESGKKEKRKKEGERKSGIKRGTPSVSRRKRDILKVQKIKKQKFAVGGRVECC